MNDTVKEKTLRTRKSVTKVGAKVIIGNPRRKTGKITPNSIARRVDWDGSEIGLKLDSFAGRLTHLRLALDLTQEELGDSIGRTRQMIHSYEKQRSYPPLDVVEALSKSLRVPMSYLAFGEHAIKVSKPDTVMNIDEIELSPNGFRTTGGFVIPIKLATSYTDNIADLRVLMLSHDAPLFDLKTGDRLFVDTSIKHMSINHGVFAVSIGGELQIVRYEPSPNKDEVSYTNPNNMVMTRKKSSIKVIGAVVSTLSAM